MPNVSDAEYGRLMSLDAAVRRVISQRADDLCWRDVYTELAALVGVDFCPQLIAEHCQFAANCRAFDLSLRTDGPYVPVYVEPAKV